MVRAFKPPPERLLLFRRTDAGQQRRGAVEPEIEVCAALVPENPARPVSGVVPDVAENAGRLVPRLFLKQPFEHRDIGVVHADVVLNAELGGRAAQDLRGADHVRAADGRSRVVQLVRVDVELRRVIVPAARIIK